MHARSKRRRSRSVLASSAGTLLLAGAALMPGTGTGQAPGGLSGEILIDPTPTVTSARCDLSGVSTITFTAEGAATGPYPGTFTESAVVTIGPQTTDSTGTSTVGRVQTFEASFRIVSGDTVITGRKTLPAPSGTLGQCYNGSFPTFDPAGGSTRTAFPSHPAFPAGRSRYTATIATPTTISVDAGESPDIYFQSHHDSLGNPTFSEFYETFASDGPPPNRPPDCSTATLSATLLWPPNHALRTVQVSGVTDPDPGDAVDIAVVGVTQDEPTDGLGDGDVAPDAVIGSGGAVELRAERSGQGDGRVYLVAFKATDARMATCTGSLTVSVPRDLGSSAVAVDSRPPSHDSTAP